MAWFKCHFHFDAPKAGWGETWYLDKSTLKDCFPACENLANKRARLLGKFCTIESVRVSNEEPPRKASELLLNIVGSAYQAAIADVAWNGVLVTISDPTETYDRAQIFRGVPDDWLKRNEVNGKVEVAPVAALTTALENWIVSARENGFHFRDRSVEGAHGTITTVTIISQTGNNNLQVTPAFGLALGDKVTFSGATGTNAHHLKGTHVVKELVGISAVLNTKVPVNTDFTNVAGAKYQVKVSGHFLCRFQQLKRAAKRDTGRPFGLGRGRQSAKRKSLSTPAV